MTDYDHKKIERKWQEIWEKEGMYKAEDFSQKEKLYLLVEFPYPSGDGLHIGHAFTNTTGDILARFSRMNGKNVLYPMGWDAFGLPTENSAIKNKVHPSILTKKNTTHFKEQNQGLGISFDWSREIDTTDSDYYHWTQWIFLQLYKKDLAYKAKTRVGWCPKCKIILANEEIVSGKCERCGTEITYKEQEQWILKITAYADRLADELDLVDYPDYVKKSQREWIGRSEGVFLNFDIKGSELKIEVFTTAIDTVYGISFLVLSPELAKKYISLVPKTQKEKISNYIDKSLNKSELERQRNDKSKTGIDAGFVATNPLSGREIPVFVADYVLSGYGTGAVMGVPGHDARDHEFAKQYQLPIIPVIKPISEDKMRVESDGFWDYLEIKEYKDKTILFGSGKYDGLTNIEAKKKLETEIVRLGCGKRKVVYHLRDWIFSRQHYWGEPIPIIHCPKCGMVPVPEADLPVTLPEVEKYEPTDTGESPLAKIDSWVNVTCPTCGGPAKRETDTMPNWAGSSWYYLRYSDPKNKKVLADRKKLDYWQPVDVYIGGAEHTTLHLLYSRFWHKVLNDLGVVPGKEPYQARRQHGVILAEDGFRMSKSRGNTINPDEMVEKFGADSLRLYLMFMGPFDSTMAWNTAGLEGMHRFVRRLWKLFSHARAPLACVDEKTTTLLHKTVKKVTEDIKLFHYNTAIAQLMILVNALEKGQTLKGAKRAPEGRSDLNGVLEVLCKLVAPFAPHLAEEVWEKMGHTTSVHTASWPKWDEKYLKEDNVTIIIQVNGKLRSQFSISNLQFSNKAEVEKLAQEQVAKWLEGKTIKKTIYVPGKLVNFVV